MSEDTPFLEDSPDLRRTDEDIDTAIKYATRERKITKYPSDMPFHRRIAGLGEEIQRRIDDKQEKAKEGKRVIFKTDGGIWEPNPRHPSRSEVLLFFANLENSLETLEELLYSTDYYMRYKSNLSTSLDSSHHVFPVPALEYYTAEQLSLLELLSSMRGMLQDVLLQGDSERRKPLRNKKYQTKVEVLNPNWKSTGNISSDEPEPARFIVQAHRRNTLSQLQPEASEELLEIQLFPLEYADYTIDTDNQKLKNIIDKTENATISQMRDTITSEFPHQGSRAGGIVQDLESAAKEKGAESPHMTVRYARGNNQIELRGNLIVRDSTLGFLLSFPEFKSDVFVPVFQSKTTKDVRQGLSNQDANRLYSYGVAMATIQETI